MSQAPLFSTTCARAVVLTPEAGEQLSVIGGDMRVLIDGESSGGYCCVFDCTIPSGDGPPLHMHEREDEHFFVLEGRFKFSIDGSEFFGEPGAFACAPRGSVHAFRNAGSTPGRLHITCTPSGLEDAFRAVRIPEPGSGEPEKSPEEFAAEFGKFGITFMGPPLAL